MTKKSICLRLFLTMFKIGLFTFGGGYAMIAFLEDEFVAKKKWMEKNDFLDMLAIAESTPGPIAINSATYIGYRSAGVLGSVCATLGVCLPSFIIIFIISLFFDAFLEIKYVEYAFRGIQVAVIYLILSAGLRMLRQLDKTPLIAVLFVVATVALLLLSFFAVSVSAIVFVLAGGAVGLSVFLIGKLRRGGDRS